RVTGPLKRTLPVHPMRRCAIILLLLTIAPVARAAPPTTRTDNLPLPQQKQIEQLQYQKQLENSGDLGHRKLSDLFELSIENGDLVIKPKLPPTDRSRVEIDGLKGPAVITAGGDE